MQENSSTFQVTTNNASETVITGSAPPQTDPELLQEKTEPAAETAPAHAEPAAKAKGGK